MPWALLLQTLLTTNIVIDSIPSGSASVSGNPSNTNTNMSKLTEPPNPNSNQQQQQQQHQYRHGQQSQASTKPSQQAANLDSNSQAKADALFAREMANFRRVCYLRMDAKTTGSGLSLSQVDGSLCTHLVLAFATVDAGGHIVALDSHNELESYLSQVDAFKRLHPNVRLMISICNQPEVHNGFVRMASDKLARKTFARSSIDFLQRHNLDGIDLDWEFPNFPHNPLKLVNHHEFERAGLTKICQELRAAIVEDFYARQVHSQHLASDTTGVCLAEASEALPVEAYLLTVAVAGQDAVLRSSYELKQLASLCDWLNVMSYDYFLFKPYTPFTGPNSPLHPVAEPYVPVFGKLSFCSTVNRLLLADLLDADKIVMGVPMYARAYRLLFRNSRPAPFTLAYASRGGKLADYLDYRELCELAKQPSSVEQFDERARVPYLLADDGYTWVSFENERSLREKVQLIKQFKLAGYMTWNLNCDDFEGSFPLHRVLLDELVHRDRDRDPTRALEA